MADGLTCAANGPGLEVAANGGGFPANNGLDEPQTAAEIPRERQTRTSCGRRRSIAAGAKKNRKQKTFQNGRKTKPGGSGAEVTVFWSSLLSHRGYTGEPGTQE